jgi:phosphatidylcholine synthase
MTEVAGRSASQTRLVLAWGVHLFTASGAVAGVLALLCISKGMFSDAALLMIAALGIDAIDGTLARAVGVSQILPRLDGRRLDDIVDYLNFAIVPTVFMASAGCLPGWGWAALPILASAYGFSQADAKTADNFFLGWPSYWNVLALYLWLLGFSPVAGAVWVALLSLAVFLPLKYVYPSKVGRPFLRHTLSWGGVAWAALLVVSILLPSSAADLRLIEISLGYLVYYMGVSVWLGDWRHGWA